jgi:hypothetical protein
MSDKSAAVWPNVELVVAEHVEVKLSRREHGIPEVSAPSMHTTPVLLGALNL